MRPKKLTRKQSAKKYRKGAKVKGLNFVNVVRRGGIRL